MPLKRTKNYLSKLKPRVIRKERVVYNDVILEPTAEMCNKVRMCYGARVNCGRLTACGLITGCGISQLYGNTMCKDFDEFKKDMDALKLLLISNGGGGNGSNTIIATAGFTDLEGKVPRNQVAHDYMLKYGFKVVAHYLNYAAHPGRNDSQKLYLYTW
jgi:hypothetical protein